MNTLISYLLVVTFFGSPFSPPGMANDWTALKGSPYDGVAVRIHNPYSIDPLDVDASQKALERIRNESGIDPWPWIFMNRIFGLNEKNCMNKTIADKKSKDAFLRIVGMDLENKEGARKDFLDIWTKSLTLAKNTGAPGIVLDSEAYNDYDVNTLPGLTKKLGKKPEETIALLKALGSEMADSAAAAYPTATVWTLMATLGLNDYRQTGYCSSPAYIYIGFLDRCNEKGYKLKLIAGGELWIKYCSADIKDLRRKITVRQKGYQPYLDKYSALELAGTISPWDDPEKRSGWLTEGACKKCDADKIEEFEPYFKELAKTYKYNWIYAAIVAPYNPLNQKDADRFNPTIQRSYKGTAQTIEASGDGSQAKPSPQKSSKEKRQH